MKVLLLGGTGQVGCALHEALAPDLDVVAPSRAELDLCNLSLLHPYLRAQRPRVVVNAAAYTAVDRAEDEPVRAFMVNADAVDALAQACAAVNALLIHYSTDYVFDGEKGSPYVEEDDPHPLNVYGASKLLGESRVRATGCDHLVLRTGWVYSARGSNFPRTMLRLARERVVLGDVDHQFGAPTPAWWLAEVTAKALRSRISAAGALPSGTYHVTATGRTSWHAYATRLLDRALARGMQLRVDPGAVMALSSQAYGARANRPRDTVLSSAKLTRALDLRPPAWEEGLERFLDEVSMEGIA